MSDVAIQVQGLGKQYFLGGEQNRYGKTLRESLTGALKAPFRKREKKERANSFWALKDVEFEIKRGDVVGIIGRNGAGKSTLLKILSRITDPTEGEIEINGRVGSLLEVGTGFHHELTGRENVFLNGAILGMKRVDIARKFDEIVAFAGTEKFLDTPVKFYSSGMYMRLAFAVAAHLEPEILIVDEVLAVGDAQFQKKCLGKMDEVAKTGRTVLFVSHNMTAVSSLCNKAIWLNGGKVCADGEVGSVMPSYLQAGIESQSERFWPDPNTAPGDDRVRMLRARVSAPALAEGEPFDVRTELRLEFEFLNKVANSSINISINVFNLEGEHIFNTCSVPQRMPVCVVRNVVQIPGNLLNDGIYRVQALIVRDEGLVLLRMDDVIGFEIADYRESAWHGKIGGAVRPLLNWTVDVSPQ